jgi:hypothetical protein
MTIWIWDVCAFKLGESGGVIIVDVVSADEADFDTSRVPLDTDAGGDGISDASGLSCCRVSISVVNDNYKKWEEVEDPAMGGRL